MKANPVDAPDGAVYNPTSLLKALNETALIRAYFTASAHRSRARLGADFDAGRSPVEGTESAQPLFRFAAAALRPLPEAGAAHGVTNGGRWVGKSTTRRSALSFGAAL